MKQLLLILLLTNVCAFAQNNNLTKEDLEKALQPLKANIQTLKNSNETLKKEVVILGSKLNASNAAINSLSKRLETNTAEIKKTDKQLGQKIAKTESMIQKVDESLSKNSLYGIIGVLAAILLSGLLYWLLNKRQQTDKTDFIDQLSKTKSSIEESLVKEFGKQTELMDTQLQMIEQQKNTLQATPNVEPDHSLALKVASEINLIERNISLMDSGTKGLKQLSRSVSKLKDNLEANGYEIPMLLGKKFNEGMKVIISSSLPDENLEKGSEIITKVLIPQVNYNGKMIQSAQIQVSVGV